MKHFELEINQFIDNELDAELQKELFVHFSICEDCRVMLSEYISIKNRAKDFYSNLNYDKDQQEILQAVSIQKTNKYNYRFYISAAAAIVICILFIFQLNEKNEMQKRNEKLQNELTSLKINYDTLAITNKNNDSIIKIYDVKLKKTKQNHVNRQIKEVTKNNLKNESLSYPLKPIQSNVEFVSSKNSKSHKDSFNNLFYKIKLDSSSKKKVRDLLYRQYPFLDKDGVIIKDTAIIRDLLLREGRDKFYIEPVNKEKKLPGDVIKIHK